MNVQQLKILLEVCSGKTLAETADKLGLKQPTVSFHLRKLEEELGLPLFHKQARSLRPNDCAADLLPYARRIVSLMDEARDLMEQRRQQSFSKLKLGASYTPATYFLPPYLAEFQRLFPGVRLTLTVKKAESVLQMLRKYEIDAGIVSLGDAEEPGVAIEPIMADELMLLLSPDHRLAERDKVEVADLREETFLLHETGSTSRTLSEQWAGQAGLAWHSVMELGAIETIKEAIKCNIGIGVLPRRSVLREVEAGELAMRSLPQYINRRNICLVYREEEQLTQQVRVFIEYIRHTFLRTSGAREEG